MRISKNILLIFTMLFFSCTNYLKIVEANKIKSISGLQNGKNYIDYSIKIESKINFSFESLELNNIKINENLYIKDLSTGLSSTKINSDLKKGVYLFGFRSYNTNSFNKDETIAFNYLLKSKKFQLKKQINIVTKAQINR